MPNEIPINISQVLLNPNSEIPINISCQVLLNPN